MMWWIELRTVSARRFMRASAWNALWNSLVAATVAALHGAPCTLLNVLALKCVMSNLLEVVTLRCSGSIFKGAGHAGFSSKLTTTSGKYGSCFHDISFYGNGVEHPDSTQQPSERSKLLLRHLTPPLFKWGEIQIDIDGLLNSERCYPQKRMYSLFTAQFWTFRWSTVLSLLFELDHPPRRVLPPKTIVDPPFSWAVLWR